MESQRTFGLLFQQYTTNTIYKDTFSCSVDYRVLCIYHRGFSGSYCGCVCLFQSEVSELEHIYASNLTTRDAPFGTEDTPSFKEKIIGGRYVSVLERPYGANAPKYEKLSMVSDKPNHVDPRTLNDFSRRYNKPYQESHSFPGSPQLAATRGYRPNVVENEDPFAQGRGIPPGRPTNLITKRPDSKDIASRFPLLPPIEENRLKNHQISTVFEPEAWTNQYQEYNKENMGSPRRSFNSRETYQENGVKPLYNPRGSGAYGSKPVNGVSNGPRHSFPDAAFLRREEAPLSKEEFVKKLINMLPKNVFLPENPLILTQEDEARVRLLQVLAEELRDYSPLKLRDIYLDIANTADKQLCGFCQYQDLYYSMSRQMFNMPGDLLQVTAAMFVSGDRPNRDVNYEKFLSFVGLALKQAKPPGQQRPKTPVERQVDNYFADSEQAKLVSTVEQQLRENEYIINFSKLENELLLADRLGKGVLDLRTIMDVCYQLNIPLQSSVLNRVLQRCRLNSYDDCYNWRTFLDFLGKAQPARNRSEPVKFGRPSPAPQPQPQAQYTSPPASKPVTPLWRRNEAQAPQDPRRSYNYDQYDDNGSRGEVISRMDQDIRQLERNYEEIKEKLRPRNDTPWFKNFMEFANALYKQDQRYEGDLPAEDVYRWTKMYNDAGNLGFPDHFISRALSDASKGGKVNIHTYLSKLGNVSAQDKIA
ncbi:hypothetical protein BaRGS_00023528 [Batillaria attramentaria]|uniref:Uncharacterized protein n=1 Tax=Batillaria attramentaria TaxID=370345 RepID=A0ABD0KE04_9CAEN